MFLSNNYLNSVNNNSVKYFTGAAHNQEMPGNISIVVEQISDNKNIQGVNLQNVENGSLTLGLLCKSEDISEKLKILCKEEEDLLKQISFLMMYISENNELFVITKDKSGIFDPTLKVGISLNLIKGWTRRRR